MSLSRETFCSGETHTGPSMGCRPWCQLCALRCGPTFHGPTDLGTAPRRCCTGVFSVGFQVWCSPGHRGVLCYYPWVGSPHCLCREGCKPDAPEPAAMHPKSHTAGTFAPSSSRQMAEEMPSMPHQAAAGAAFGGRHHLLGTTRLPQDGKIAPTSL